MSPPHVQCCACITQTRTTPYTSQISIVKHLLSPAYFWGKVKVKILQKVDVCVRVSGTNSFQATHLAAVHV